MAACKNASEAIASLNTAKPLANIPSTARSARVSCRTQNTHYREDGGDPTSTAGTPLVVSATTLISGRDNLLGFRIIEDAASATIWVDYFDTDAGV